MPKKPLVVLAVCVVALGLVVAVIAWFSLRADDSGDLEALDLVPADTDRVFYTDRAAIAADAGVDDVEHGASEEDLRRYAEAMSTRRATNLDSYVSPMQEAPFSSLDVTWEVSYPLDEQPANVYRMRDDLDLDEVAKSLEDSGWTRESAADHVQLSAGLDSLGQTFPPEFMNLSLFPDEHLIVTGAEEAGVQTEKLLAGDDSMSDDSAAAELLGPSPLNATIILDPEAFCTAGNLSPEQLEEQDAEVDESGLATFEAIGLESTSDEAVARLQFGDSDTAEQDAAARTAFLEEGTSRVTGQPLGDLVVDPDITTDGKVETVTFTLPDGRDITNAQQFIDRGLDGPVACGS